MATGSPATLFATRTAIAPAATAFRILTVKAHVPRETSAILPARLPAGSAEQAMPRPPTVGALVTTPSGAVRSSLTVAKSPAAAPTVLAPLVTGAPTKCGTVLAPAVSARAAEPGDSTVKRPG